MRFAYAYRNTDVRLCVVGSIAFYLFFRFQIKGELWPDFSPGFNWHHIKLLRPGRGSPSERLLYPAQLKAIKEVFERFNIDVNCYTHAGRKAAVQIGEIIGVEDAELRKLGHWDATRMAKHYSTGIARGAARQLAGVKSRDAGHYYLKRGQLKPPESLLKIIFPRIEESYEMVMSLPRNKRDKAAAAFLQMMQWFREVILQDAVELKALYPNSPLWSHTPFNTREFMEYQQRAQQAQIVDQVPKAMEMERIMPEVALQLQSTREAFAHEISAVSSIVNRIEGKVTEVLEMQDRRFGPLEQFANKMNRGEIKITSQLQLDFDSAQSQHLSSPDPSEGLLISTSKLPESDEIPTYEVNIAITSVEDAYMEWEQGLINGPDGIRSPSIQYLENTYGPKWRRGDGPRQRFTRRKALIERIKKAALNLKLPESDIAHRVELWRKAKGITLNKVQKLVQNSKNLFELWGVNDCQLEGIH